MFQLDEKEFADLKSQNATSSWGGRRKLPSAFTEHGVLMLSSVLNRQFEKQMIKQDEKIELLFTYLSNFIEKEDKPRTPIGFRTKREE